ncbi:MAG: hypothetical protein ACRD0L_14955 [Acidimicrobiales bacterium]
MDAPRALPGRLRYAWLLGMLVALAATLPVWLSPGARFVGTMGDPETFSWYLAWVPHALAHGLNPLEAHMANAPYGVNLMWNTWMPLAGLLLSPITLLFGPLVSYNLLIAGALLLNVPAAFAFTRRVTDSGAAALVGAGFFGICPFVAGHALMHPNLALAAYPPLLLALLADAASGRRRPRQAGLLVGLATTAQLFLGEEVLAITTVGVALLGCYLIVAERPWLLQVGRRLAHTLATGAAVCLPLVVLPLAWQFLGPQRISGPMYPPGRYSLDLAGLVVPTHLSLTSLPAYTAADAWSGDLLESTGYLLPIIILSAVLRRCWWPTRRGQAVMVTSCAALALAFGPALHIAGHRLPIPGPGSLFVHLPVLSTSLPARLTLLPDLGAALAVSIILGRLGRAFPERRMRTLMGAVALLTAVMWLPAWPMSAYTPEHAAGALDPSVLRAGDVVEFAPTPFLGFTSAPMLWQAQDSFRWTMGAAYLISPQEVPRLANHHSDFPCLDSPMRLHARSGMSLVDLSCPSNLRHRLRSAGVTVLVAWPSPWQTQILGPITSVLGRPQMRGGLAVWRLAPPA